MLTFKGNFNLFDDVIDFTTKSPQGEVGRWLNRKGAEMEAAAKAQVGVRTGRLRQSISRSQERTAYGQKLVIVADSRHAYYHHEGTRPHIIAASGRGNLRFTNRGRIVTVKSVRHPGNRANRFLSDQLKLIRTP